VGFGLCWAVALIWRVPDRRIERVIGESSPDPGHATLGTELNEPGRKT